MRQFAVPRLPGDTHDGVPTIAGVDPTHLESRASRIVSGPQPVRDILADDSHRDCAFTIRC